MRAVFPLLSNRAPLPHNKSPSVKSSLVICYVRSKSAGRAHSPAGAAPYRVALRRIARHRTRVQLLLRRSEVVPLYRISFFLLAVSFPLIIVCYNLKIFENARLRSVAALDSFKQLQADRSIPDGYTYALFIITNRAERYHEALSV